MDSNSALLEIRALHTSQYSILLHEFETSSADGSVLTKAHRVSSIGWIDFSAPNKSLWNINMYIRGRVVGSSGLGCEAPGSNLCPETGCHDGGSSWTFSVPSGK